LLKFGFLPNVLYTSQQKEWIVSWLILIILLHSKIKNYTLKDSQVFAGKYHVLLL
jgi:hypothetical protein